MPTRSTCSWLAALVAGYLAAGAAANLAPPATRPFVALGLMALLTMLVAAASRMRPRTIMPTAAVATALALGLIHFWRRRVDPTAALGPVPPSLEPLALGVLGGVDVAVAAAISFVFAGDSRLHLFRWVVFGATACALVELCVLAAGRAERTNSTQGLLQRVVLLEPSPDPDDWSARQELSTALAILGRQRESREIPLSPDAVGRTLADPPGPPDAPPPFAVVPWRDALARIAAQHRLVLIMEAHTLSEHRAWIEQALAAFRAAGYTDYLAEAVAEPGARLEARGHPTTQTGVYTLDPRFGNLLRTALRLGFAVDGYDAPESDFARREDRQAAALAARFASRPDMKMLVHAGHGHVFKHDVRNVGRYMAARLWAKSGVEPFTIWQLSNAFPSDIYARILRKIGPIDEPVMLVPPPRDVSEALFPESTVHPAVDALLIHPPRLGREPTDRRGTFADHLTRVPGVWRGGRWPVVIAAVADGETDAAVPLDQILLRPGETDFELWVPHASWSVRVWSLDGPLDVRTERESGVFRIH